MRRSTIRPSAYPTLRFAEMDARRLAYDRRFDVIFSNATLHWVDDIPAFLAGSARLLKPTRQFVPSRLIISCGGAGNAAEVVKTMERQIRLLRWAEYFRDFAFPYYFYAPSDYAPWLAAAGFTATRLALVEKDMTHAGRDGLAGWMRTTWMPYTHRVPEARREAFLYECVDDYLREHPLDGEGRSHVRMVRLEAEAHLLKEAQG